MKRLILCIASILVSGCSHSETRQQTGNLCHLDGGDRSVVFEKVSAGSVGALKRTLASLPCLDGGDLEDAHIAIGEGLFRFPSRLAPHLYASHIEKNDLKAISTMLPASFVDESCKSAEELRRRKKLVQKMDGIDGLKQPMLEALEESLEPESARCKSGN